MHIINRFSKTVLSSSILMMSSVVWAHEGHDMMMSNTQPTVTVESAVPSDMFMSDHSMHSTATHLHSVQSIQKDDQSDKSQSSSSIDQSHDHHKEHGGQINQATTVENKWMLNEDGQGELQSKIDTWVGSDENKLFFKAHLSKAESALEHYDIAALYSRNVADFWDVQAGVQYLYDKNKPTDKDQVKAMFGVHGMAPYFFETDAYLHIGQDQQVSLSLETERDFLFTQKLITQPYLDAEIVLSDDSKFAQKTGLSSIQAGIQTRYEISKKVMPFIDVAYRYDKGNEQTVWQERSDSESGWLYGAGISFKF